MIKPTLLAGALLFTLPVSALAGNDELAALRAEFEQKLKEIQQTYESRLQALEARQRAVAPAVPAAVAARANDFNPELSLTLQGSYAERAAGERPVSGFLVGGHDHGVARGFNLDHTELTLAANIDPTLRGYANVALVDGAAEVEEAWFQTLALGQGLSMRGGRFLSGIGYANEQHPHAWDFADNSLMYRVLFGEHFAQDGVQLKWLAPTDTFIELGAELGRGSAFPGSEAGGNRNGAGAWALFAHVGGDAGDTASWRAGVSYLHARPQNRSSVIDDTNEVEAETLFTGRSNTWIADFVWKWAPDGHPRARHFKLQTEYFHRGEDGDLVCPDNRADGGACGGESVAWHARQTGWYAQGVYQFTPRWRVGLRYDRLDSGAVDIGTLPIEFGAYTPSKWSVMTDFSPSEFSRFRLQWVRDHATQGSTDNRQLTLQYIHSLGAHGAHKF